MIRYFCDICSAEIAEKHKKAVFVEPGHFGAVCEMDFCDHCFRVLTGSKMIHLKKTQQDISDMELKITDEREDPKETAPAEEKTKKPAIKMPKIKTGRPKKLEEAEPLPEPDEPEEDETRKQIDYGKMLALYRAGWKVEEIADDLHCGKSTVYNYIAKCKKEGKL